MNPRLAVLAAAQGGVFSRGQALRCGYTAEQIRDRLTSRAWVRIRHGQYAEPIDLSSLTPSERRRSVHRRQLHAVMNSRRRGSVAASHQSAVLLHGLPDWGLPLDEVHINRLDDHGAGRSIGVREHVGKVPAEDLTLVDGRFATTVPRAVVETACIASFEAAVVVADAAARIHRISAEVWARLLTTVEFWPGSPTARAAFAFMNPLSESVGESRLRILMENHGLPKPELQVEFHDAQGFVARVDFHFPAYGVVVEFDGMVKYADASAQVLIQEKVREDRLRALGLQVIRATWADLASPNRLITHIRGALSLATAA